MMNTVNTPINTKRLAAMGMETPTAKRRSGRPPKCSTSLDSSPAANLSAAVARQGSPKVCTPLMRVSPSKAMRKFDSSPLQHQMNVLSSKGGALMMLDDSEKVRIRAPSANQGTKARSSKSTTKKCGAVRTSRVSVTTQQNIHTITSDYLPQASISSVNPTLLLSSPISASKISEINRRRVPTESKNNQEHLKAKSNTLTVGPVSSSPMTPNSVNSSCFSSIMRSSPLYHGYYANQTSPGTSAFASSPMRLQLKPMSLSEDNHGLAESKISKKESMRNASDSTSSKISEEPLSPLDDHTQSAQYKLSFTIDESGKAKVTKEKIFLDIREPPISTPEKPKLTRHQSLANTSHPSVYLGRSSSLTSLPTLKSSSDFGLFHEPTRYSNDTFFSSISDELGFETLHSPPHQDEFNFAEDLSSASEEGLRFDQGDDDGTDYDARSALIKMIRRSL